MAGLIPGSEIEAQGPEAMPTYYQCVTRVYETLRYDASTYGGLWNWPGRWLEEGRAHMVFTVGEVSTVLSLAVVLTLLRYGLSYYVFLPFSRSVGMLPVNQSKFPESAFKLMFYSGSWAYSFWLMYNGRYDFMDRPCHVWDGWHQEVTVPTDIAFAYLIQMSFYLHSVYGTIYMDAWRKDSIVMLFHHFITMALIGFSYGTRYHNIGMLILYLHDISDVCLEFSKCNVYLKLRNNRKYALHDHLSVVGFLGFAGTWFVFRLYWFPLKAVYAATYGGAHVTKNHIPCFLFFNILLLMLQVLHVYWFMFILNFLYKVATGQMKEVDDVREENLLPSDELLKAQGGGESISNGVKKDHIKTQ